MNAWQLAVRDEALVAIHEGRYGVAAVYADLFRVQIGCLCRIALMAGCGAEGLWNATHPDLAERPWAVCWTDPETGRADVEETFVSLEKAETRLESVRASSQRPSAYHLRRRVGDAWEAP